MTTRIHGLCQGRAREWDLDQGSQEQVLRARRACEHQCPLLDACRAHLARRIADGDPPLNSVQAGIAFGCDGRPLSDAKLRRVIRRRRPEPALSDQARKLIGVA